jgi:gonadotropin-releasing hormone receptor
MTFNSSLFSKTTCPTTGTHGPEAPFYHWLALGYAFLFILALTANLRVLFKLFHYSRRRFRDHILLLNLCAADLFVTLVYIPSEIYAYTIGRWHNDEICKIIAALKGLGIYVSSCTIIGISLDRYLSIVHPLTVYQSNIRNKLFVVGSWLISILACIPQVSSDIFFLIFIFFSSKKVNYI